MLAMAIIVQRKTLSSRKWILIYGFVLLLLALPALMGASAVFFSHERGIIRVDRAVSRVVDYLPLALYFLQFPVGTLAAVLLTSRVTKYQAVVSSIAGILLMIQFVLSFEVMFLTSLEISGDSI